MRFTAGETLTVKIDQAKLVVKIEDASKSNVVSARVEAIKAGGDGYKVGQVYQFDRDALSN